MTNDKDQRRGWLRDLKIGDPVFVDNYAFGATPRRLVKVERITPTGRIVVDGENFSPEGLVITSDRWTNRHLSDASSAEAREQHLKNRQKIKMLGVIKEIFAKENLSKPTLDYDKVVQIYNILVELPGTQKEDTADESL